MGRPYIVLVEESPAKFVGDVCNRLDGMPVQDDLMKVVATKNGRGWILGFSVIIDNNVKKEIISRLSAPSRGSRIIATYKNNCPATRRPPAQYSL